MLTWKIWAALSQPLFRHPLFQRIYASQRQPGRILRITQVSVVYFAFCAISTFVWPLFTAHPLPLLIIGLALSNNLLGMFWSDLVSGTIIREHEQKTYDLLSLTPHGALGAGWLLATAALHRSPIFRLGGDIVRVLLLASAITLLVVSLIPGFLLLARWDWQSALRLFVGLLNISMGALAFCIDYMYSVVLAHLTGLVITGYIRARIIAAGSFLLLKISIYLLAFILSFMLPGGLFAGHSIQMQMILPLLRLMSFIAIHEIAVRLLWRAVIRRYPPAQREASWIVF